MKFYEIPSEGYSISDSLLDQIEFEVADMENYKRLEDEFISNLMACRAFHKDSLNYKDVLLCKDMFKKGYLAAHVRYMKEDK